MEKQRTEQEIKDNMRSVWSFVAGLKVEDKQTQETCLKQYHRVVKGEISSDACIRKMKQIIEHHAPR